MRPIRMRPAWIELTQEDIDIGQRCIARACPAHRAISRHVPDGYLIAVGRHYVEFGRISNEVIKDSPNPASLSRFVVDFDKYGPSKVWPFGFSLLVPAE